MTARPTLVVASGNAATIWDYQLGEEGVVNTFYPHGEHNIADICWNHNGQGMFGLYFYDAYNVNAFRCRLVNMLP